MAAPRAPRCALRQDLPAAAALQQQGRASPAAAPAPALLSSLRPSLQYPSTDGVIVRYRAGAGPAATQRGGEALGLAFSHAADRGEGRTGVYTIRDGGSARDKAAALRALPGEC